MNRKYAGSLAIAALHDGAIAAPPESGVSKRFPSSSARVGEKCEFRCFAKLRRRKTDDEMRNWSVSDLENGRFGHVIHSVCVSGVKLHHLREMTQQQDLARFSPQLASFHSRPSPCPWRNARVFDGEWVGPHSRPVHRQVK